MGRGDAGYWKWGSARPQPCTCAAQWDEVAQSLGTGRTPAGCLAQYQRQHKGEALLNSKWTPEEATRLATVIARLGTRDWQVTQQPCLLLPTQQIVLYINVCCCGKPDIKALRMPAQSGGTASAYVQAVAAEMGGRTPGQVQHFYQDNLQNTYKKGTWAPEEDEALKQVSPACCLAMAAAQGSAGCLQKATWDPVHGEALKQQALRIGDSDSSHRMWTPEKEVACVPDED